MLARLLTYSHHAYRWVLATVWHEAAAPSCDRCRIYRKRLATFSFTWRSGEKQTPTAQHNVPILPRIILHPSLAEWSREPTPYRVLAEVVRSMWMSAAALRAITARKTTMALRGRNAQRVSCSGASSPAAIAEPTLMPIKISPTVSRRAVWLNCSTLAASSWASSSTTKRPRLSWSSHLRAALSRLGAWRSSALPARRACSLRV